MSVLFRVLHFGGAVYQPFFQFATNLFCETLVDESAQSHLLITADQFDDHCQSLHFGVHGTFWKKNNLELLFNTSLGHLRQSLMRVHNHIYWSLLINLLITADQFDDHCWSIWWSLLMYLIITADHICWSLLVNLMITADRIYWSLLINLLIPADQFDDHCWSLHFRGYGIFLSI